MGINVKWHGTRTPSDVLDDVLAVRSPYYLCITYFTIVSSMQFLVNSRGLVTVMLELFLHDKNPTTQTTKQRNKSFTITNLNKHPFCE